MFGSWNPSQYKFISDATSVLVKAAKGLSALQGLLCATSTTLIVQVWDTTGTDATTGAVQITGSITLTAGQSYPVPAKLNYGLYIKVISGTGTFTVFYD